MNNKNVLLGVLAAAAGGALLGVLLAPDKGTETRKKLSEKGRAAVDKFKSRLTDLVDQGTDRLDNLKNDGRDLVNMGKSKFEDTKKDIRNVAS